MSLRSLASRLVTRLGIFPQLPVDFTQAFFSDLERHQKFFFGDLSDEVLQLLFEKTASYWRTLASEPEEIYWSVITRPEFKKMLSDEDKLRFLMTGQHDVKLLRLVCTQLGVELASCNSYLEYGCGVGRTVFNLPPSIREIHCVDFSHAHLEEAKKNLRSRSSTSVYHYHLIDQFKDIKNLPGGHSFIHSVIVLQHNTPPIIEATISVLLSLLAPKGVAVLHLPIARGRYTFDPKVYLHSASAGQDLEMHILPKANLYDLALRAKCSLVYSFCGGGCGGDIYSEYIVFQKS
jgi:SAM-dependent methyltransferase